MVLSSILEHQEMGERCQTIHCQESGKLACETTHGGANAPEREPWQEIRPLVRSITAARESKDERGTIPEGVYPTHML